MNLFIIVQHKTFPNADSSFPLSPQTEFELDCCSHKLTLKDLDHNVQYCLQAQTTIPLQAKSSVRSAKKCVTVL